MELVLTLVWGPPLEWGSDGGTGFMRPLRSCSRKFSVEGPTAGRLAKLRALLLSTGVCKSSCFDAQALSEHSRAALDAGPAGT